MPRFLPTLAVAGMLAAGLLGAHAIRAADRSALRIPDGLAFSEFDGYEHWQVLSVSDAGDVLAVILGNPVMVDAFRAGIPDEGSRFPDGAKMAKLHWFKTMSMLAPTPTAVPGGVKDIDFMVKDSKRFPDSNGWGYAVFKFDAAAGDFAPEGRGTGCGAACHQLAASRDHVFTSNNFK